MAGTLLIDTLKTSSGPLATQNAMSGIHVAWVNFGWNGSAITIRKSFNTSSVTRSSAGVYVMTFTTALADSNYAVCATGCQYSGSGGGSASNLLCSEYLSSPNTFGNRTTTTVGIVGSFPTNAVAADGFSVSIAVLD